VPFVVNLRIHFARAFRSPDLEKISRRNALSAAVGALGVLAAQPAVAAAADAPAPEPKPKGESIYKFKLYDAPVRTYGDSSVREHKTHSFPMSPTMAAASIRLGVGAFREPHWHPNSDEWLMVLAGKIRMTVVDGKGEAERFTCGLGDVASVPQGFGHYVENVGDEEAHVLVVHNNGEFTTVELSDWVAGGSTGVFASTLNIPEAAFENSPKKRVFIGKKKKA
jgi:oxalate decarboxylase